MTSISDGFTVSTLAGRRVGRGPPARRLVGALGLAAFLFAGPGCQQQQALEPATSENVERAVQSRMADVKHCWAAGDKKKSWLAGELQHLAVEVLATGKVRVTFEEAANNKHPVGSCMRSALDGLRFAPSDDGRTVRVPVRLGQPLRAAPGAPSPTPPGAGPTTPAKGDHRAPPAGRPSQAAGTAP